MYKHTVANATKDTTFPSTSSLEQSKPTSTGDVVLDAEISIGATWVVAGCEDYATNCLYLADHTGDCWCGHDAILTNNQMINLEERNSQCNVYISNTQSQSHKEPSSVTT